MTHGAAAPGQSESSLVWGSIRLAPSPIHPSVD